MKICIIETEFHHEVIIALVNSLSVKNWQITILTNSLCFKQLEGLENCALFNFENDGFNASRYFNEYPFDKILFITPPVTSKFDFLYHRSSLLIHNMNFWFHPNKHIYALGSPKKRQFYNFLKWTKYLPEILFKRNKIITAFSSLYAPSKELFEYIKSPRLSGYLDLRFPIGGNTSNNKDHLHIVIPGTINESRNYVDTLKAISFLSKQLKQPIKLTLLGHNKINMSLEGFENEFLSIIDFEEPLSQSNYEAIMRDANFGILPILEHKSYKGIIEYKGKTNISGAINDFYTFGIPAIVPDFYPIDKTHFLLHHFNTSSLESTLKDWIEKRSFKKHKEKFDTQVSTIQENVSDHNSQTLLS